MFLRKLIYCFHTITLGAQIFLGAALGLLISISIGAAYERLFLRYTVYLHFIGLSQSGSPRPPTYGASLKNSGKVCQTDSFLTGEQLLTTWVLGIFELVAALMIFVMGVTMMKMDRGKPILILLTWGFYAHYNSQG